MKRVRLGLLIGILTLNACAAHPSGWHKALRTDSTGGINGAWTGTWQSNSNGHTGSLKCVVEQKSQKQYEFRYWAAWAGLFSARFSVDCDVAKHTDGKWSISGTKDLGPMFGGIFTHQGTVQSDTFSAQYDSRLDRGIMNLQRTQTRAIDVPPHESREILRR